MQAIFKMQGFLSYDPDFKLFPKVFKFRWDYGISNKLFVGDFLAFYDNNENIGNLFLKIKYLGTICFISQ